MCLAIPMKIEEILDNGMAKVSSMGTSRTVAIDLTPNAQVDDYVLVHAGFAIEIVDEQYAQESLEIIKSLGDLVEEQENQATSRPGMQ